MLHLLSDFSYYVVTIINLVTKKTKKKGGKSAKPMLIYKASYHLENRKAKSL